MRSVCIFWLIQQLIPQMSSNESNLDSWVLKYCLRTCFWVLALFAQICLDIRVSKDVNIPAPATYLFVVSLQNLQILTVV